MSISGTLSNYYVDSIISHEGEDPNASRFSNVQYSSARQPGPGEHPEFPSCSFQPKPPVFSSSWSPFSSHASNGLPAVYHPYIPTQPVPSTDTRYLRTWLDCAPRAEPLPGQGQVKMEPLLGHLGEPPKLVGQHEYILESSTAREMNSSHSAGFEDNKDICEGSEDKEGPDQNDPSANWLHARSSRKKRCPYTKYQTLELEKEFLFNMYLTRDRRHETFKRKLLNKISSNNNIKKMSSYFVNSLFTKYKSGDTLRPNYYECGFAQDLGTRPTVVYGPGTGATFQHAPQIQEFYHHGASTLSAAPYQQSPCTVTCHGEPGNFYGYDALQRQTLFSAQDADLVQYSDCKLAAGGIGDETDNTEQSPSPTQLFPWMRPQGEPR
ncbi:hypothetical protein cypCar_00024633 [Cyprinus carpio]|nr:hypothetical protein cypCar_00024633 [Cyprinus carpio]